jgi:hypothetical protein
MSEITNPYSLPDAEGPFEAALQALLAEREKAGECALPDKATILGLAARVPAQRRALYLARLAAIPTKRDGRGTDAYKSVINLIDRRAQPEWTNAALQAALAEEGIEVGRKEVGNFAAYLVKAGRFERLARGHYRDRNGRVIVTADDLLTWNMPKGDENED